MLLIRSTEGHKDAYRLFLQELTLYLRAKLRKQIRVKDSDVDDLIQEVLIAVHIGLDTFTPGVPVTAWISAISRYKLVDHLRAVTRWNDLHTRFRDNEHLASNSEIDVSNAKRDIASLLKTLPKHQSVAIVHTKLFGRSTTETASATGLTESAVKVGVHRGLKNLVARTRGLKRDN
jgi:RNA polymerase sigma-70 factor (ECF subfamily)